MKRLLSFFQVGTKDSFGRLASGVLIGAGILIAIAEVTYSFFVNDFVIHTALILELILIGKGGKVASKWLEGKKLD